MLDDTLIVFGGEFGRTPGCRSRSDGRDHHIKAFSYMLAGGGIKPGLSYGASDEFGYAAVENPVSVHDFHATLLHLLGIDHMRLTVNYQGLDARLSGVGNQGRVVKRNSGRRRYFSSTIIARCVPFVSTSLCERFPAVNRMTPNL